jgi:hypothetical protein
MGGHGSGRSATYAVIEGRRCLDIRKLRQRGRLRPGAQGSWTWTQDGECRGGVGYRVSHDGTILLNYSVSSEDGGERELIEIAIQTRSVPCRYGGSRTYFLCPRCWRRCELIAMTTSGRQWGCRKCLRLRYTSQRLAPADRMERRADALWERAGADSGDGLVVKQKWMRWRTYKRLMKRADALSNGADAEVLWRLRRFGISLDGLLSDSEEQQRD